MIGYLSRSVTLPLFQSEVEGCVMGSGPVAIDKVGLKQVKTSWSSKKSNRIQAEALLPQCPFHFSLSGSFSNTYFILNLLSTRVRQTTIISRILLANIYIHIRKIQINKWKSSFVCFYEFNGAPPKRYTKCPNSHYLSV